jgi:hypothetical protein
MCYIVRRYFFLFIPDDNSSFFIFLSSCFFFFFFVDISAQEGGGEIRISDIRFIRRGPNRLNYLLGIIFPVFYYLFKVSHKISKFYLSCVPFS